MKRQTGSALVFVLMSRIFSKLPSSGQGQNGSALVFVLIIIAGIVTVTIGAQRLALVQFNQATREADNTFAYYAAKSGIEDGLLRFRYQRNVETTFNKVHRFDLTDGRNHGEINATLPINATVNYDTAHQYYDLSVNFKTNQIGDFDFRDQPPKLDRDDELQLTGFPNTTVYANDYFLRYAFKFVGNNCRANNAFVQIQQIVSDSNGQTVHDQRQATITGNNQVVDSKDTNSNLLVRTGTNLSSYIRIRPYHCDVEYAFTTALSNNGERGGPEFDSLISKITATGYFGKTKRTLQAEVDRKSGTVINIYDFNLYAGQGNIRPR